MGIATDIIELVTACIELGFKAAVGVLDLANAGSSILEHFLPK
jgi:hypothetical protein